MPQSKDKCVLSKTITPDT